MRPLYIFDLDGTLALIGHRRHFINITGGRTKPDWRSFFAACVDDQPNLPVIETLHRLLDGGCDVLIWSARSAEVMEQTKEWLASQLGEDGEGIQLTMRLEGDFTPDEVLKEGWLNALSAHDRRRLVAVFDDRARVVEMWRRNGVACFQVAPGEF